MISLSQTKFLNSPIISESTTVHSVGTHSSSGNAPASISQISWISVLIGSIFLYLAAKKVKTKRDGIGVTVAQLSNGAAICMLIFFFTNPILIMAKELIPKPTYNLIYQWVPLRFSADGLRDILFFHND